MTFALLRLSLLSERRRAGSPLGLIMVAVLVLAAAALLWLSEPPRTPVPARAGAWVFWSLVPTLLVGCYSTFDILMRRAGLPRFEHWPIPPDAQLRSRVLLTALLHLPVLLVPALTGLPLLRDGHVLAYGMGVLASTLVLVASLSGALAIHIATARSLISGQSPLKAYLAQGLGPPEAALLFYGPAAALVVGLVLSVGGELAVRASLERGQNGVFTGLAVIAVVTLVALRRTMESATEQVLTMFARFRESEILPPFRENGLPRRVYGERAAALLPAAAASAFRRLLLSSRRRYRIVPILVVLLPLLVLTAGRFGMAPSDMALLAFAMLLSTERTLGREVGLPLLARGLPVDPAPTRLALWTIAATELLPVTLAALVAPLLGAWPSGGTTVFWGLLATLLGLLGSIFCSVALALRRPSAPAIGAWAGRLMLAVFFAASQLFSGALTS